MYLLRTEIYVLEILVTTGVPYHMSSTVLSIEQPLARLTSQPAASNGYVQKVRGVKWFARVALLIMRYHTGIKICFIIIILIITFFVGWVPSMIIPTVLIPLIYGIQEKKKNR